MQVPPQLQYNQLQARAFFSSYKQWPIQPIANGGQYWPGQVIRIYLNALTDGVMDPYRSHIQITVSSQTSTLPVGLLQIDNSAQSFIQQMVLSSRNRQIQRIIQYGALAAYLTDIGMSQLYTQGRQSQGLGYSNLDNYQSIFNQTTSGSTSTLAKSDGTNPFSPMITSSPGTIFPTIPTRFNMMNSWGSNQFAYNGIVGSNRSHISWTNCAWLNLNNQTPWWDQATTGNTSAPSNTDNALTCSLAYYGYATNIRAQYLASSVRNNYVDSTTSMSNYEVRLSSNVQNQAFPSKFTNGTIYNTYLPQTLPYFFDMDIADAASTATALSIPNSVSILGFTNLYSPMFAKGVFQPFISPTVPQCQMANGVILPQKVPVSTRTFKIPLISSVMGLLIPQSQFVLLPLKAVNDVLIEITIDPSAMFTSGYNDIAQYDNTGMGLMQQRAFKITRLIYNLHTYQFYNPQMDQYLKVSLTTGIAINTQFWQLGNQYQVQNSQSISNSWPVACNQEALNQILVLFYPMDYQNFSFCRKHFRLSNNITKLQLRINMQYYPSQPLTGNAGNPIELDSSGNNGIFLQQIFQTNGYMFSSTSPMPRINAYNFAINDRCYNIFNTHTLYDPAMIQDQTYAWSGSSLNVDTALGMSNVHQNRYVGKAAYVYSFQPHTHSQNFLTGIDCRAAKQFDIIFACNPVNWFPRPQMMLIYTRSSVIIEFSKQGIVNINK